MARGSTLTAKQAAFAALVASGRKQVDAYIQAFDVSTESRQNASNEAYRLMLLPKVKDRVEALKADKILLKKTEEKLSKEWIIKQLCDEASNEENSSATRVRALEILAKTEGLFHENSTVIIDNRSAKDIEEALKEKLSKLFDNDEPVVNDIPLKKKPK